MSSISAPTSLATFAYTHASSSRPAPSQSQVTLAPVEGSRSRLAVAGVQGNGVWTYDIKTLKPTTSFTVPPSTVFSTAPVSFVPPATATLAEDGMDVEEGEQAEEAAPAAQRVTAIGVQSGEGVKDGRAVWVWQGDEGERQAIKLGGAAQGLMSVDGGWPLLVVLADGGLVLINSELEATPLSAPKNPSKSTVVASGMAGKRIVLVLEDGSVRVLNLDVEEHRASLAAEATVSANALLSASVVDGVITAVDSSNHVVSRAVSDLIASTSTEPTASAGLALAHPASPACILSVAGSSRPLAITSVPSPTTSVALVSTLPELPAVLATTSVSSVSNTSVSFMSIIARPTPTHFVLGAVVNHPDANNTSGRSLIVVADVTVPSGPIGLSQLVDSARRTAAVFTVAAGPRAPAAAERMADNIAAALRANDVDKAEKTFAAWRDGEEKNTRGKYVFRPTEQVVRRVLRTVFSAAIPDAAGEEKDSVDDSAKPVKATGPYAGKIVRSLIELKAVTDNMWPGGVVLAGLVPCNDWRSISLIVRGTPSLTAKTTVSLLALALADSAPASALPTMLEDILAAPLPDPSFRAELHRRIDGAGAQRILAQYATWAEDHASAGDGLSSWPEPSSTSSSSTTPRLASLLPHASLLLDAHLPTLLALDGTEALLTRLQTAVAPLLAAQQVYRRLRTPIDSALAAAEAEKERAASKKDASARRGAGKGRDEVVGKWKVEDFVF